MVNFIPPMIRFLPTFQTRCSGALLPAALFLLPVAAFAQITFVDLNPTGATQSYAYATTGAQQAGYATSGAGIWSGTAASFVNLNPSGASYSIAYAIIGTQTLRVCCWSGSTKLNA